MVTTNLWLRRWRQDVSQGTLSIGSPHLAVVPKDALQIWHRVPVVVSRFWVRTAMWQKTYKRETTHNEISKYNETSEYIGTLKSALEWGCVTCVKGLYMPASELKRSLSSVLSIAIANFTSGSSSSVCFSYQGGVSGRTYDPCISFLGSSLSYFL